MYRVGDEEQKAQETARVEEAIARRKQEKEQWGTVLSGLEGGSLSGLPELTQPGTGTVGDLSGLTTLSPDDSTTAQQPEISTQQPETSTQQPETGGWVTDSVQAAFIVIDELQRQGYEFVTVEELLFA